MRVMHSYRVKEPTIGILGSYTYTAFVQYIDRYVGMYAGERNYPFMKVQALLNSKHFC